MRRIYAARRRALIEALKPGEGRLYEIDASPAGLMLLLRLPEGASDEEAVRRLARKASRRSHCPATMRGAAASRACC